MEQYLPKELKLDDKINSIVENKRNFHKGLLFNSCYRRFSHKLCVNQLILKKNSGLSPDNNAFYRAVSMGHNECIEYLLADAELMKTQIGVEESCCIKDNVELFKRVNQLNFGGPPLTNDFISFRKNVVITQLDRNLMVAGEVGANKIIDHFFEQYPVEKGYHLINTDVLMMAFGRNFNPNASRFCHRLIDEFKYLKHKIDPESNNFEDQMLSIFGALVVAMVNIYHIKEKQLPFDMFGNLFDKMCNAIAYFMENLDAAKAESVLTAEPYNLTVNLLIAMIEIVKNTDGSAVIDTIFDNIDNKS